MRPLTHTHTHTQVDADMESDAVVVGGEDVSEMGQERDLFLASIKGLARPDMRMRYAIQM
jgi:hypothetical protein